jgi:hypothetical protein
MIKTTIVAAAFAVASGVASAAPINFAVDWANSSVSLTETGGGGLTCLITSCGISASLVGSGGSFSVDEGQTEEFGFIRFEGDGTTGFSSRNFDIAATLTFDPPTAEASGTGSGGAFLLLGSIIAGNLTWSGVPDTIVLSNGSVITIDFEGGSGWLLDGDHGYTLNASVKVDSLAPVPLPAGALLLIGGLGALGAARLRKTA